MGEPTDDRGDARTRILAGAERLILRSGLGVVTVDQIATQIGMSKKTIYEHFASKDELELAVIDAFFAGVDRAIGERIDEGATSREQLVGFFHAIGEQVSAVNVAAFRSIEFRRPELWDRINDARSDTLRRHLGAILTAGQRAGEIRVDIGVEFMVEATVALVVALATPSRVSQSSSAVSAVPDAIARLVIDGVSGGAGAPGDPAATSTTVP